MAGWMIMGGSVLVVATVFETITSLNTLETREAVSQFLSEPPGEGLGLDVPGALLVLRTVSMVAAGCAAVAAVLGFHVLRRNRSARLGVTVVAIPLFFTGMVTGGFLSSVVAASALLLWLEPARNWFDGVPAPPSPERAAAGWPPPTPQSPEPPPSPPAPPRAGAGNGAQAAAGLRDDRCALRGRIRPSGAPPGRRDVGVRPDLGALRDGRGDDGDSAPW